jgi:hypothetical protein
VRAAIYARVSDRKRQDEESEMSKKTKATKHAARVRSHKKRRPNRINPLVLPARYVPKALDDALLEMAFDQALLGFLRSSGIRDAILKAIKKAPPKDDEPSTVQ